LHHFKRSPKIADIYKRTVLYGSGGIIMSRSSDAAMRRRFVVAGIAATYMLLGLILCVGYDLIHANAIKNLLLFAISPLSLVIFSLKGEVDWSLGAFLAIGSVVGSGAGSWLATKEWAKVWVFRLLVVIILVEIVQLVRKYHLLFLL
jgi:uncharacterized membrane protein YfcA